MLQHFPSNSVALATKFENNLQSTAFAFMEICFCRHSEDKVRYRYCNIKSVEWGCRAQ